MSQGSLSAVLVGRYISAMTSQHSAITLHLNIGNATVSDLKGKMDLQLNAGNLTVSSAQITDGSSFRFDAGNITANLSMTQAATHSVQVNAGNASLTLPRRISMRG